MVDEQDRIVRNPAMLGAKPKIRGTRMSVEFIIGVMADGWSVADILANYPHITRDHVAACLCYARQVVCTYRGPLRRELHS